MHQPELSDCKRILYIQATFVPPPRDARMDRFFHLSETVAGDVLQPVWFWRPEQVEAEFGPGSYPVYTRGRFRYHWFLAWRFTGLRRRFEVLKFYLRAGLPVLKKRRTDCIVVYSHMLSGVLAGLLKILTGVKLITEIVTAPDLVYVTDVPRPGIRERFLHFYSDACLHFSLWLADRAHLLFPSALSGYRWLRAKPASVFHEFVPVSSIPCAGCGESSERYLLLVGAPWYPKGVDLLVKAFRNLASEFPNLMLKILGHYEDRSGLDAVVENVPNIEILESRPNSETLKVIASAAVMVLPSRCEGMPRVLLEAMAAGVPVVASDAGGIRWLLQNGECGLLFQSGDAAQLEQRLRTLLSDGDLQRRLGESGYRRAHAELNERNYVEQFTSMIEATCAAPR
jgi:glycosyltransferase involved in cell wall biosynthesis